MRFLVTMVLLLAITLHLIDLSAQFDRSPDSAPDPFLRRDGTLYRPLGSPPIPRSRSRSPRPEIDPAGFHHARLPPAEYDPAWIPPSEFDPARFHPDEYPEVRFHHAEPSPSEKSSPSKPPAVRKITLTTRLPTNDGHGCGIENLGFIRLTSRQNLSRIFELRRYTFPEDTRLKLRVEGRRQFESIPTQEQIVMSSSDGEVYAILKNANILAGLYLLYDRRGKINMQTGKVTLLTQDEVKEAPVGPTRLIFKCYEVKQLKNK